MCEVFTSIAQNIALPFITVTGWPSSLGGDIHEVHVNHVHAANPAHSSVSYRTAASVGHVVSCQILVCMHCLVTVPVVGCTSLEVGRLPNPGCSVYLCTRSKLCIEAPSVPR
jgi:hypothetical protein